MYMAKELTLQNFCKELTLQNFCKVTEFPPPKKGPKNLCGQRADFEEFCLPSPSEFVPEGFEVCAQEGADGDECLRVCVCV